MQTSKVINWAKANAVILISLLVFFCVRIFSYFFQPAGPLVDATHPLNTILSTLITLFSVWYIVKRNNLGWYLIAGELILGGSGNYLQVFNISLRSVLLIFSLSTFFVQERNNILNNKNSVYVLILIIAGIIGGLIGKLTGNLNSLVFSDSIPYLYILYYFPLKKLLRDKNFVEITSVMIIAAIAGNALFILLTFVGFSSGILILQDSYYHWFRDVANGKITHVAYNFYRLVLNDQLLLVPVLIFFAHKIIKESKNIYYLPAFALLFTLSINLTRIYLIALLLGVILLFSKIHWKKWLATSAIFFTIFLTSFSFLYLFASSGKSLGLEVFGLRLQSIVSPNIESSSLSRMILLPEIGKMFLEKPFFGNGLGSTISVYSPVFNNIISTPHFDWGYLEILAELGILGATLWSIFILRLLKTSKKPPNWQFSSLCTILAINLTSPALFHVFGLIFLALLLALTNDASEV